MNMIWSPPRPFFLPLISGGWDVQKSVCLLWLTVVFSFPGKLWWVSNESHYYTFRLLKFDVIFPHISLSRGINWETIIIIIFVNHSKHSRMAFGLML